MFRHSCFFSGLCNIPLRWLYHDWFIHSPVLGCLGLGVTCCYLRVLFSPPEHVSFGTRTKDSLGYMRSRARARASTPLQHGCALSESQFVHLQNRWWNSCCPYTQILERVKRWTECILSSWRRRGARKVQYPTSHRGPGKDVACPLSEWPLLPAHGSYSTKVGCPWIFNLLVSWEPGPPGSTFLF